MDKKQWVIRCEMGYMAGNPCEYVPLGNLAQAVDDGRLFFFSREEAQDVMRVARQGGVELVAEQYETTRSRYENMMSSLPRNPEIIYRVSGEWRGWAHFLDADTEENRERDALEERWLAEPVMSPQWATDCIEDPESMEAMRALRPRWFDQDGNIKRP